MTSKHSKAIQIVQKLFSDLQVGIDIANIYEKYSVVGDPIEHLQKLVSYS